MPAKKKTTKTSSRKARSTVSSGSDNTESQRWPLEEEEEQVLDPQNPFGPTEDPIPRRWNSWSEEFRVWMHSAKGWLYGVLLIAIVGPVFYMLGTLNAPGYSDVLENYFSTGSSSAGTSTEVAYSIGEFQRSRQEVLRTSRALATLTFGSETPELNPGTEDYKAFIEQQYETDLLAHAALKQGLLNDPLFVAYLDNSMRESVARAYVLYSLKDRMPERSAILGEGSPAAMDDFKRKLKTRLTEEQWKNLTSREIIEAYRQSTMQKIQEQILLQRRLLIQKERSEN